MRNDIYQSEYSVVGTLCYEPRCMERIVGKVTETDFDIPACAEVFSAAHEAYICGKPFDAIMAADCLTKLMTAEEASRFVKECMEVSPSSESAERHAKLIHRDAGMRNLKESVLENINAEDPREAAAQIIDTCQTYLANENPARLKTLQDALGQMYDNQSRTSLRLDTGFPRLDSILKGVWGGNLVIIGARPGVGKSAFAMDIARTVAYQGNKVLIYSLEMLADEWAERLVARESEFDLDTLIDNKVENWERLSDTCSKLSNLPIFINDDPSTTVGKMRAEARSIRGLKLIIVDFVTLMHSDKRYDNRNLEIGAISRALKNLASELQIPIIALAQLNRGTDDTEMPTLRSLRDSGELEQNANKVLLLWNVDKDANEVGVSVSKNRRGKTGVVKMAFDGNHMKYTELSEAYDRPKRRRRWDGQEEK